MGLGGVREGDGYSQNTLYINPQIVHRIVYFKGEKELSFWPMGTNMEKQEQP